MGEDSMRRSSIDWFPSSVFKANFDPVAVDVGFAVRRGATRGPPFGAQKDFGLAVATHFAALLGKAVAVGIDDHDLVRADFSCLHDPMNGLVCGIEEYTDLVAGWA